jgi:hypothetical protein
MSEFCERHPELCPKYYEVEDYTTFGNRAGRRPKQFKAPPPPPTLNVEAPRRDITEITERPRRDITEIKPRPRRDITEADRPAPRRPPMLEETDFGTTEKRKEFGVYTAPKADVPTRAGIKKVSRKIQKQREKILKSIELETQVVEHSPEEFKNAVLSQASYENAYKSTNRAEKFVKSKADILPELADFEVIRDPRFTNNNHTAFRNARTGEVYLSYRGSDGDFFDPEANIDSLMRGKGTRIKNAVDWGTNLHTLGGQEHKTTRYKNAVKVAQELAQAEGISIHDLNTTGHSLGGGQSDHVSEVLGSKSVSFDPARNPFAKRPIHERSRIKSFSTMFDPVSLARNAYARYRGGEPDHIEHKNYTAVPAHESGTIDQHLLDEQFVAPMERVGDKIVSTRTTKIRNASSMLGGAARSTLTKAVAGLGGAAEVAQLALPFAITPEYETKGETAFRQTDDFLEGAKITMGMSNALFKVNPMFALLDEPAMIATVLDFDPMLPPEAKRWVQKKIGLKVKEEPARFVAPPKAIQALQSKSRRKADEELKARQRLADAYGITLQEAINLTPETDEGVPLSEGALERAEVQRERFEERTERYREEHKDDDMGWMRFYNPDANPYPLGLNPYGLGSKESREYQRKSREWEEQAREEAQIEYAYNQAEIRRWEREQELEAEAEAEYKYEQSPEYALDLKEEQMAIESQDINNIKI